MSEQEIQKIKEKIEIILYQQNKINSVNRILSDIVYQWKLPLSIIATASTGIKIKEEMNLLNKDELISSMELINKSAQELSQTIDEFNIFLTPHDNKTETFSILNTFERIFKLLNIEFLTNNIEIIKNIENIKITSLENKLSQVLVNILSNSIDATQNTPIDKKVIFINVYKNKDLLIIDIKNNIKIFDEKSITNLYDFSMNYDEFSENRNIDLYLSSKIVTNHLLGELFIENKNFRYKNDEYEGTRFLVKIDINIP